MKLSYKCTNVRMSYSFLGTVFAAYLFQNIIIKQK